MPTTPSRAAAFGAALLAGLLVAAGPALAMETVEECLEPGETISDTLPAVESVIDIESSGEILDVDVSVDIVHPWIGDLVVDVTSPSEVTVILHSENGDFEEDIFLTWDDEGDVNGSDSYDCGCAMQPATDELTAFDGDDAEGEWVLTVADGAAADDGTLEAWCLIIEKELSGFPFLRGDADSSGGVSGIPDARFILEWQFALGDAPLCEDAADVNDDGSIVALQDAIFLLTWFFLDGGVEPPAPGPDDCGLDPTEGDDDLDCDYESDCS